VEKPAATLVARTIGGTTKSDKPRSVATRDSTADSTQRWPFSLRWLNSRKQRLAAEPRLLWM
jgi:hypothetical protein